MGCLGRPAPRKRYSLLHLLSGGRLPPLPRTPKSGWATRLATWFTPPGGAASGHGSAHRQVLETGAHMVLVLRRISGPERMEDDRSWDQENSQGTCCLAHVDAQDQHRSGGSPGSRPGSESPVPGIRAPLVRSNPVVVERQAPGGARPLFRPPVTRQGISDAYSALLAASMMVFATTSGCETITTWDPPSITTSSLALARVAMKPRTEAGMFRSASP